MRIVIINWSRRRVAGTEEYLNKVVPELHRAGHSVAFWHESDEPFDREPINLPANSTNWCVANLGRERALASLRQWAPDLVFTNSMLDPGLEAEVLQIAPSVFFAHAYYGTCISQAKTFKYPSVRVCDRRFGWKCLLHYYPHRCGGLSPVTMFKQYALQSHRLNNLKRYDAIVTFSSHMQNEYIKNGIHPDRLHCLSKVIHRRLKSALQSDPSPAGERSTTATVQAVANRESASRTRRKLWRITFLGRMELLKGGHVLIDALERVSTALDCDLHVTFAGDGAARHDWEQEAERLYGQISGLTIEFVGWITGNQVQELLEASDLLVLPSLWPEPFGLVGLEAGLCGVPTVAFAVGGISDWLIEGINGHLAAADPPDAAALAAAIVKCLKDQITHDRLRSGATRIAEVFNLQAQVAMLLEVFELVVSRQQARSITAAPNHKMSLFPA